MFLFGRYQSGRSRLTFGIKKWSWPRKGLWPLVKHYLPCASVPSSLFYHLFWSQISIHGCNLWFPVCEIHNSLLSHLPFDPNVLMQEKIKNLLYSPISTSATKEYVSITQSWHQHIFLFSITYLGPLNHSEPFCHCVNILKQWSLCPVNAIHFFQLFPLLSSVRCYLIIVSILLCDVAAL